MLHELSCPPDTRIQFAVLAQKSLTGIKCRHAALGRPVSETSTAEGDTVVQNTTNLISPYSWLDISSLTPILHSKSSSILESFDWTPTVTQASSALLAAGLLPLAAARHSANPCRVVLLHKYTNYHLLRADRTRLNLSKH
jgi:hypothetical protein